MIKSKDIYKEIKDLEKMADDNYDRPVQKGILKSNILLLKVLTDIRTNLVKIMEHKNVPLQKPFKVNNAKK